MTTSSSVARGPLRAAFVRRPHGVGGELRVEPLGGDAARFVPGLRLLVEAGGRALTVARARPTADGDVLLRVAEVVSREQADALRDAYLCVEPADRRPLGADEWFVHELVGLEARRPDGTPVGEVVAVEHYSAQDVLVLRAADGSSRRLPLVRAFVTGVDLGAGVVEVTPWPEEGGA